MGDGDSETIRLNLQAKIDKTRNDLGLKIEDPIARFNLNLDGGNNPIIHKETIRQEHQLQAPGIPEKILQEMSVCERIADQETGQNFGIIKANWDKFDPDKAVTVALSLYGNECTNKDGSTIANEVRYRHECLAAAMPERALIAMEYPSYGASDSIRANQMSTDKKDSYYAIADAQLRALKEMGVKK